MPNPMIGIDTFPFVFKPIKAVAITAGTPVAVWTPASGKRFRLLGFCVVPTVAASVLFEDATGGANEFLRFPPTTAGNYDNQTAFASGTIAVGSTTYGPFTNLNADGVMVFLNITAIATGTVILHIQGKDPVTNAVVDLLIDAFAITANGLYTFILHTGSTPIASTSGTAPGAGALRTVVSQMLPRTWQITAVVATAGITASISYAYLTAGGSPAQVYVDLWPSGYLSTAANNALFLDVTATATVSGFVYGTEE